MKRQKVPLISLNWIMNIKHQNTFYSLMFILSFCLLGSLSCKVTHSSVSNNINWDSATKTPQIIFLNYSIKLDKSKGEYEIRLINKIITEGKLKIISSDPEISKPGDLECVALDNNLEPVDSIIISDPLNITVESVDENNALFKKEIARDSAQFYVRMQLNEKIHAFGIKKNSYSEFQNSYLLITNINQP
jgi:hypothetical protein